MTPAGRPRPSAVRPERSSGHTDGVPLRRLRPRPVLRAALRLLRLRHLDRPAPPRSSAYLDALRDRHRAAVAAGHARRSTSASSSAAARRRWCPPTRLDGACSPRSRASPGAEVTVECNPDTVDRPTCSTTYVAGGVNRISLGVQSMVPHVLAALGRTHDPANVAPGRRARPRGRASQRSTSTSSTAARGRSLDDWAAHARRGARPRPAPRQRLRPHGRGRARRWPPTRPATPTTTTRPTSTCWPTSALAAAGLASYEISNWARPGHECRHNLLYWAQGDYLGFGCAAHSHRDGRRWWNVRTPERYVDAVADGRPTEAAGEELEPDRRRVEGLQLALRTADGRARRLARPRRPGALDGLVVEADGRVRLTVEGRLLANEVAVRLR